MLFHCYVNLCCHINVYTTSQINKIWILHIRNMDIKRHTLRCTYIIWTLKVGCDYVDLSSYYYFFYKIYQISITLLCTVFYYWPSHNALLVVYTKHAEAQYPTCQEVSQALQCMLSTKSFDWVAVIGRKTVAKFISCPAHDLQVCTLYF